MSASGGSGRLVPLPSGALTPAEWERADPPPGWGLERLIGPLFAADGPFGDTWAVAVAHRGRLVFERYGGRLPAWGGEGEEVTSSTRLLSWSVAKSVLHAAVGILVGEGRVDPDCPVPVPEWSDPGDPRRSITWRHLLTMRDGLDFVEDYDPGGGRSDVIEMLFGGVGDTGRFAADRPLAAPPGSRFNYSSGTSNIISRLVSGLVGSGSLYEAWLEDRLFAPLGMHSAVPDMDQAGTWVASSYLRATARDWLRFGEFYLRDGHCASGPLLPPGWVDFGRTPMSEDTGNLLYGAHWWTEADELGTFWADGYEGQTVTICPALETVFVRFGRTPEGSPVIPDWRRAMVSAMAAQS